MNNTFSIHRFSLLLKRQWLEFGKIYLITLAVVLGVIITFYGFATWSTIAENYPFSERLLHFREPLFLIFGFLFITVIASSYFAHLGQKPKAIIDLMIPASTFEKFLTGILFTAVLSTISFLVIFYLTDLAFVSKLRSMYHSTSPVSAEESTHAVDSIRYFFSKNNPGEFKSIFVLTPFFVTSLFLLGSIYFNRFHYIKTAISLMIFSGIWTFIIVKAGQALFEGRISVNHGNGNMDDRKFWVELAVFSLMLLLTAIVWSITYVRLKEKEV
ncbi:hypothetical protein [Pedobacter insulae]|uniref:ABC-2 family transporter protein n=1 Tax=Pedobacter insulae TaxID=414048 RepID=A0A1I2YTS3_9SPHI|nr:hypothetical protein [Pedobacter insulae]SFH29032.1 hypothetical protein SAMN04489864_10877 [Pedobacter insulae]